MWSKIAAQAFHGGIERCFTESNGMTPDGVFFGNLGNFFGGWFLGAWRLGLKMAKNECI